MSSSSTARSEPASGCGLRRSSASAAVVFREQRRSECLRRLRSAAVAQSPSSGSLTSLDDVLRDKEFTEQLFALFDDDEIGVLDQTEWFETLRVNVR